MLIFNFNCYFFTLFRIHNNNCSTDLYNRDLQTKIIFFTQNRLNFLWIPLLALFCLLYYRRMFLSSRNCLLLSLYFIYVVLAMFTYLSHFFILILSPPIYLFISLFCIDVIVIFFLKCLSRKKGHYFWFWSFFFIILITPFSFS